LEQSCGKVEGAIDELDEGALFAKDEAVDLREGEVFAGFGVLAETRAVCLVRGKGIKGDETPCDVVGAFVREEVADEMAAEARDDASPGCGVLVEALALKWVDLVANEAGNRHRVSMPIEKR